MICFSRYIYRKLFRYSCHGSNVILLRKITKLVPGIDTYLDPLKDFRKLLDEKDYIGLTDVMVKLKQNNNHSLSLMLFEEMVKKGIYPSMKVLSIELSNLRISGKYEEAVSLFEDLSKKSNFPEPVICVEYLRSLSCLNDKEKLYSSVLKVLEKYPGNITINDFFCNYLFQQGEYRKLYKYFLYLKHHKYHISTSTLNALILCSMKLNHNDYIPIVWNYHLSYQGVINSKSFSLYIAYLRHTDQFYEVLYHVHDSLRYNPRVLTYSILPPLLSISHSFSDYYIVKHTCDFFRKKDNHERYSGSSMVKIDNPKFQLFFIISSLYSESVIKDNNNIERIKELFDIAVHILSSFNDYSVLYISALRICENNKSNEILYGLIDKIFQIKPYTDVGTDFIKFCDLCYREKNYQMIINVYEYMLKKHKKYKFSPTIMTYTALSYFYLGRIENVKNIIKEYELEVNENGSKEQYSLYVSLGFSTLYHLLKKDSKCKEYLTYCCKNKFPLRFQNGLLEGMLRTSGKVQDYGIFNGFVNSYLSVDSLYHPTDILDTISEIYKNDYGNKKIPAYVSEKLEILKKYSKKCDGLLKVIKEEDNQE